MTPLPSFSGWPCDISFVMKTNNEVEPVEIFSGTIWEAELLKSLLENEEIEAFLKDEITGTLAPWYTAAGGMGSVKVIVSNLDFDKAKTIVEEFEKNRL
jgi:hypothetical protein